MMKKHILIAAAAAMLIPSLWNGLRCQGTAAGFLNINADALSSGMGEVTTVASPTEYAHWNNSSAVSFAEKKYRVGFGYGLWQPSSSNVISLGGYAQLSRVVSLTAGFKYLTYRSVDITDETGKIVGSAKPKDMAVGAGLSFKVCKVLSLSASLNYVMSDLAVTGSKKANCVSADFGATVKVKRFTIATTFSNIGSKVNYGGESSYALPANWKAGFGAGLGSEKHAANLYVQGGLFFKDASPFVSGGAEYVFDKMVAVRGGYYYGKDIYMPGHASVGLGFQFFGVHLDASYLIPTGNSLLKNTFMLSLAYAF